MLSQCQHVLRETLRTLQQAWISGLDEHAKVPNVAYELNDVRPMPAPAASGRFTSSGPKLTEVFFIVNQYIDAYCVVVAYDAGKYSGERVEEFVEEWIRKWMSRL